MIDHLKEVYHTEEKRTRSIVNFCVFLRKQRDRKSAALRYNKSKRKGIKEGHYESAGRAALYGERAVKG